MGFELIAKKVRATNPDSIKVSKNSVCIGANVLKALSNPKMIEVYEDTDKRQFALKGSSSSDNGYKIVVAKENPELKYIHSKKIQTTATKAVYAVTFSNNMAIFTYK